MSVLTAISRSIVGFFVGIVATFRRLMCFLHVVRRRKNSGSLLPLVNDHSNGMVTGEVQTSLPSNDYDLEPWESWGSDPSGFGASVPGGGAPNHTVTQNHNVAHRSKTTSETEPEQDIDFFTDMAPEIKKPAKILVRKKEDPGRIPNTFSSRLAASTAPVPMMQDGELSNWEEEAASTNAWGSETLEDLSWEAESALKEKRRQEREWRQQEQQRRKQEKQPAVGRAGLTGVKLS